MDPLEPNVDKNLAPTGEPIPEGEKEAPALPASESPTVNDTVREALDPSESSGIRKVLGLPGAPPNVLERNQKLLDEQTARDSVKGTPLDDDATRDFTQNRQESQDDYYKRLAESEFGGPDERVGAGALDNAVNASKKLKEQTTKKPVSGAALDIIHGVAEAPTQAVGGARDAAQAMISGISAIADEITEKLPSFATGGYLNDKDMEAALGPEGFKKYKASPGYAPTTINLPKVKEPDTVTGGLIRGTAQFIASFAAVGKALGAVGVAGEAGAVGNAAKGFAAQFAGFEGSSKKLSDLVQQFPALRNPVNAFLATDPADSEAVKRLKGAVEGLGMGLVADGFVKALSGFKQFKVLSSLQDFAKRIDGEKVPLAEPTAEELRAAIGDIEGKLFTKLKRADQVMEGASPSNVTGKPGSGPQEYINWAFFDAKSDIKTVAKKMAMHGKDDIDEARRGVRSHAETKLSAEQENAFKLLLERRKGDPFNAEESFAVRQLWVSSAENLKGLATLAKNQPTAANLFGFRRQIAIHYWIQQEVLAARTETARALNQWAIPAGSNKEMAAQMKGIIDNMGGEQTIRDMAEKISMLGTAGSDEAIEKFTQGVVFARTRDAVSQVWINSLLSNPATHVANSLSNFSTAFQQIYERKAAEFISQKFGTQGGVELGEAAAMAHGAISAFWDACRAVGKNALGIKSFDDFISKTKNFADSNQPYAFSGDGPTAGVFKFDQPRQGAFDPSRYPSASENQNLFRGLEVLDITTRLPGRMLGQADDFFKSIGYRMELHAQAVRQASQEIRAGKIAREDFKHRVADIIANPSDDVRIEAVNQATYQTFQSTPGKVLKGLGDVAHKVPFFGRLLLPFKTTPANIFSYSFERTPLAPLVQNWRADFAAGGARADIAMARMATGSMLLWTAIDQAVQGRITGAEPSNDANRGWWRRMNLKPYAAKVGDTSITYGRLDPVAFGVGLGADIGQAIMNAEHDHDMKDFQKIVVAGIFAVGNQVFSKSYMKGIAEWNEALAAPDQKANRYITRLAGSLVPAGVANVARQIDPTMRAADDIIQGIIRRMPWASATLAPQRNLWGETMDYRSGLGTAYDMFVPIYLQTKKPEPIDHELGRLAYYPDMPERHLTIQGVKVQLSNEQYSRLVELQGNKLKLPAAGNVGMKDFLNQVVTGKSPYSGLYQWIAKQDEQQGTTEAKEFLRNWIERYRTAARQQLIRESKEIRSTVDEQTKRRQIRIPMMFQ